MIILLTITLFYHYLGHFEMRKTIWISVLLLITICNWYSSTFLQFLSPSISSRQRYFVEFSVVTQMFRTISYALTLCDQTDKDTVVEAIEYNFYLPLFCGPWCIYPIFRADRLERRTKVFEYN